MARRIIARRDDDVLFCEGSHLVDGAQVFYGFIKTGDQRTIPVPNIEVLLMHGFWEEEVE